MQETAFAEVQHKKPKPACVGGARITVAKSPFRKNDSWMRRAVAVEKGFSSGELNSGSPRSGEFRDLF
jgi:hypothetical protein